MRLQRDSYAPKSCAFDAANVQFLRAHLCKSHPVLQQMGGEHMTALLGKGKNPRVDDFLALAGMFDLSSREVKTALGEVCTAVAQYPELARQYDVKVPAAVRFEFLR